MQLKNTPYRIVPLSRIILFKLYLAHVNDDPKETFTAAEVAKLFTVPVSQNLIRSALDSLRGSTYNDSNYVTRHKDPKSSAHQYKITQHGIMLVERTLRRKDSDLSYFLQNGDASLDDIAGIDSIYMTPDEALDAFPWVPLPVEREDPNYQGVVKEVEAAIEAVRGDNGFAAKYPEERAGILAALEDGLTWLKDKTPSRAQIMSNLVAPLRWVASKFSGAVIGEIAKRAAQKLVDFLALYF